MMNLIHCLMEQNLLVLFVLCVSTQLHFVCYLMNHLFVELGAFLFVFVLLQVLF